MDITQNIKSIELKGEPGNPEILITYKANTTHKRGKIFDKLSGGVLPIRLVGENKTLEGMSAEEFNEKYPVGTRVKYYPLKHKMEYKIGVPSEFPKILDIYLHQDGETRWETALKAGFQEDTYEFNLAKYAASEVKLSLEFSIDGVARIIAVDNMPVDSTERNPKEILKDLSTAEHLLEQCIKHIENAEHPSRTLPSFVKEAKEFLNPPDDLIGEDEIPF